MSTLSFWEREELLQCTVVVVGSGIIGLSAAITIKEQHPHYDVVVLEREILPAGASTKNAGFACYGSLTEILHDVNVMGVETATNIIAHRKRGLDMLRARLGDDNIGLEPNGGYELLWGTASNAIQHIDMVNELMQPIFGNGYFTVNNELISRFGFNPTQVEHIVATQHEGGINSGKAIKNLALLATAKGVRLITGADVRSVEEHNSGVDVAVHRHVLNDTVCFRAERVVLCTNALATQLMPALSIKPARGQVLITHPIPQLPFKGVFHFDEGFYYFRNVGNRVLFGGGRNLDIEGETTSEFQTTTPLQHNLDEYLRTVILPGVEYTVDMRWAGIMGFNANKLPIVQRISANVVAGFGCNGMGVAIGSDIGAQAAELVCA